MKQHIMFLFNQQNNQNNNQNQQVLIASVYYSPVGNMM